ncbi:MAG TPA: hypothetical protein DDX98_04545 [Bacteroidales bacterium]|jgi:hypothetical protein|nr:hypothetical protein [Bacteroidales bacterium]
MSILSFWLEIILFLIDVSLLVIGFRTKNLTLRKMLTKRQHFIILLTFIIAVFAFVTISSILKITRNDNTLQCTIYVTSITENDESVFKGEIIIDFGHDRDIKEIGSDKSVIFNEIPNKFKGEKINIKTNISGYDLVNPEEEFIFTGDPIYLKIRKEIKLGNIKGYVIDEFSNDYLVNVKIMVESDTIIYTDSSGRYNAMLPETMYPINDRDYYILRISKDGYITERKRYFPLSGKQEIRLRKETSKH